VEGASARASETTLWLGANYRTERVAYLSARREFSAWIGLSLPWEQLVLPRASAQPERLAEDEPAETTETEPATEAVEESPTPDASTEGSAKRERPATLTTASAKLVVNAALARETVRHALSAQGLAAAERRLVALSSRSRWSAVLPELRLRAARGTDQSLRLTPTIEDPYRYTRNGGTDTVLEARLSWQLSKLIFAVPELAVERLRAQRAERRLELTRQVLQALFAWQRALATAGDDQAFEEDRQKAELDQLEAELRLNVLTGGWFTEERAKALSQKPEPTP
jgi:hypothetical protein